jgi:hypothetical protein
MQWPHNLDLPDTHLLMAAWAAVRHFQARDKAVAIAI